MNKDLEEKFEEVEYLVTRVKMGELDLANFFERLAEICDEIEGLEIIEI
jgi:hypothetical protein